MYGSSKGRDYRKAAQGIVGDLYYTVDGKKAKAALAKAQDALRGRSGLSSEEKVAYLNEAREAVQVAAAHKKVVGTDAADKLAEAAKNLKKAAKQYA